MHEENLELGSSLGTQTELEMTGCSFSNALIQNLMAEMQKCSPEQSWKMKLEENYFRTREHFVL